MRMKRLSIVLSLILIVAGLCFGFQVSGASGPGADSEAPAPEQVKPMIKLLETAEVVGPDIFLAEVAEFDSEETKAQLGKIYVGAAALSGSSRRLALGQIEVRLRQAKLDPRDFQFTGAKEVWVTTKAPVHQAPVQAGAPGSLSGDQEGVQAGQAQAETTVPYGNSNYLIYEVVVPVRDIARHEVIGLEDLSVQERTGRTVPSNLASIDDLVGKRATRLLAAGSVLTTSAAETVPLVESGDMVTLVVTSGPVIVTATGKVLQKGSLGDIVAVENVNTRVKVYGEVLSSELVKIEIGGLR